jgi:hypothetical protein
MNGPLEIITVIAIATVKLAFSPMTSLGLGYSFLEAFLFAAIGGCIGVLFFYRISDWIMKRARLRRLHHEIAVQHGVAKPRRRRVFTRRNRTIIKVKHGSGLIGLALLTPFVLTIPVGSIIAARFFRHDRRTLPALLSSVVIQAMAVSVFWNAVFNTAGNLVN